MAELTSGYLGLELRNPVVASAGPLSQSVDDIKALADAGVGAVTMFSLFEEQLFREAERLVSWKSSSQISLRRPPASFRRCRGPRPMPSRSTYGSSRRVPRPSMCH